MVLAERLVKMISAKEAKEYADEVTIAARQRKEYPILIGDIEREIVRASKMGRYSISYWLSDIAFSVCKETVDLNDPVTSAQFYNRPGSPLYAKIKNDLTEAGFEVEETFSPAAMYYWTIKWNKVDDIYDLI